MVKLCSKCGTEKELNSVNFEPRKNTKDGFRNQCRNCRNEGKKSNYKYKYNFLWSDYENNILKQYYPYMSSTEINKVYLPNRTPSQITDHAIKILKLHKSEDYNLYWNKEQLEYLKNNYENMNISVQEIGDCIGKNKETVIAMASKLNLHRTIWSKEEKIIISNHYSNLLTEELINKHLPNKTREQIIRYANKNKITKSYEFKKDVAMKNLKNINDNPNKTKPEIITEQILNELNIDFKYQYFTKYYWVDFYLPKYNLFIEVQGDYFHCNPLKTFNYNILSKNKIVRKDKSKHTYLKNKHNIETLYLWEDDLINNIEKCKLLIQSYVDKQGILDNYHSYNYFLNNNQLKINDNIHNIGY